MIEPLFRRLGDTLRVHLEWVAQEKRLTIGDDRRGDAVDEWTGKVLAALDY